MAAATTVAEHYTPTTDQVRDCYVNVQASVLIDGAWEAKEAEFDHWLATHEQQLRERIAAEIEARADYEEDAFASSGLKGEFAEKWQGMRSAAEIARGGDNHD